MNNRPRYIIIGFPGSKNGMYPYLPADSFYIENNDQLMKISSTQDKILLNDQEISFTLIRNVGSWGRIVEILI